MNDPTKCSHSRMSFNNPLNLICLECSTEFQPWDVNLDRSHLGFVIPDEILDEWWEFLKPYSIYGTSFSGLPNLITHSMWKLSKHFLGQELSWDLVYRHLPEVDNIFREVGKLGVQYIKTNEPRSGFYKNFANKVAEYCIQTAFQRLLPLIMEIKKKGL